MTRWAPSQGGRNGYVFFDVETPNRRNDRICSLGIVYVDSAGVEGYRKHFLIDPGVGFDPVNMSIHGITPSDVANRPRFMDIWGLDLVELFSSTLVVAHGASFDLSVLRKTLEAYELDMPDVVYDDTLVLSRTHLPQIGNHRLPDVCSALGIVMGHHHDALADALACKSVFEELDARFGISATCGMFYSPSEQRRRSPARTRSNPSTSAVVAINDLYGRVTGITLDHILYHDEIAAFTDWVDMYRGHREEPFLSQCFDVVEDVLSDGVLTPEEANKIIAVTSPFVETDEATATIAQETVRFLGVLRGIASDRHLQDAEIQNLQRWMATCGDLSSDPSFKKVGAVLKSVLADDIITEDERASILAMVDSILTVTDESHGIVFDGRSFCLTGNFQHGSKEQVEQHIVSKGGSIAKSVTRKCDYVVVGELGSDAYSRGTYGTKVVKAMKLRDSGLPISVVPESAVY